MQVEFAVQEAAHAELAAELGADRVELCQALEVGGLTPSIGFVREAVARTPGFPGFAHALVRPRGGGFVYGEDDTVVMERDIRALSHEGVGGFVVGALTAQGELDRRILARLVAAANGLPLTCHRALDVATDPVRALGQLVELGFMRALTSGQAIRVRDGLPTLRALVEAADGRIEVMAAGGVTPELVPELREIGVDAVHTSAAVPWHDPAPSGPGGGAGVVRRLDPGRAAALVQAARQAGS